MKYIPDRWRNKVYIHDRLRNTTAYTHAWKFKETLGHIPMIDEGIIKENLHENTTFYKTKNNVLIKLWRVPLISLHGYSIKGIWFASLTSIACTSLVNIQHYYKNPTDIIS